MWNGFHGKKRNGGGGGHWQKERERAVKGWLAGGCVFPFSESDSQFCQQPCLFHPLRLFFLLGWIFSLCSISSCMCVRVLCFQDKCSDVGEAQSEEEGELKIKIENGRDTGVKQDVWDIWSRRRVDKIWRKVHLVAQMFCSNWDTPRLQTLGTRQRQGNALPVRRSCCSTCFALKPVVDTNISTGETCSVATCSTGDGRFYDSQLVFMRTVFGVI